ncbi:hypothetical protein QBC46DRAFT_410805 [Diplogelasinospora grovesii]|uniref:Uncharacterized protein n=1 Tax=Diplogelasinospora grovesii TaxID=303347 RepID=A0AAN6N3F5_9PEZI|nr:hypothetical protein QBC46DRAFT_410805 [Diplogelasinospora grovesii]
MPEPFSIVMSAIGISMSACSFLVSTIQKSDQFRRDFREANTFLEIMKGGPLERGELDRTPDWGYKFECHRPHTALAVGRLLGSLLSAIRKIAKAQGDSLGSTTTNSIYAIEGLTEVSEPVQSTIRRIIDRENDQGNGIITRQDVSGTTKSETNGQTGTKPQSSTSSALSQSPLDGIDWRSTLKQKLVDAFRVSYQLPEQFFIPKSSLARILHFEAVTNLLSQSRGIHPLDIQRIAEKTCPEPGYDGGSFRMILALLLLVDRVGDIATFVFEGPSDQDLPLKMPRSLRRGALPETYHPKRVFACFKG